MSRNFAQPITSRIPLLMPAARICLRLLAWLGSTAGISFCSGALAALFSVVFCHQMFARFGSGLITSAATAAALSIGLLVGAVGSRVGRSRAASAIVALIPAIWVLLSGWFADRMGSVYGSFELSALASPEAQFAAALGTALLLVAVPAACGARLALGNRTLDGAWGCFGAGVGCVITAYGLGPWFGLQWTGGLAAVVTVAWVVRAAFRRSSIRDVLVDERLTVATAKTSGGANNRFWFGCRRSDRRLAGATGPTTDAGNRGDRMDGLCRLPARGRGQLAIRSRRTDRMASAANGAGCFSGGTDRRSAGGSLPVFDGSVPRRHGESFERCSSVLCPWTGCRRCPLRRRCSLGSVCRWGDRERAGGRRERK